MSDYRRKNSPGARSSRREYDWREDRDYWIDDGYWADDSSWSEDDYDRWEDDGSWEEDDYSDDARPVRRRSARRSSSAAMPELRYLVVLAAAVLSILLCVLRLILGGASGADSSAGADASGGENVSLTDQMQEEDTGLTDAEKLKAIQSDVKTYPIELRELAEKNREALDYVYDYPEKKNLSPIIDLSSEAGSSSIPLLIQWDERWGYKQYGSGLIGYTGCGPTCLSMVALYLTRNSSYDPYMVAQYAEQNGYYVSGTGTAWDLMAEGCAHFGLVSEEVGLDEEEMAKALSDGKPVICAMGPGDFTDAGHYIVLTGHSSSGFTICDPNSPQNSAKTWTYSQLKNQIKNIWAFSKA